MDYIAPHLALLVCVGGQRVQKVPASFARRHVGGLNGCRSTCILTRATGVVGHGAGAQRNLSEEVAKTERAGQQAKFLEEQLALAAVRHTAGPARPRVSGCSCLATADGVSEQQAGPLTPTPPGGEGECSACRHTALAAQAAPSGSATGFGFQQRTRRERIVDRLAHPADTSRANLALLFDVAAFQPSLESDEVGSTLELTAAGRCGAAARRW
jgi:hypothetical protein